MPKDIAAQPIDRPMVPWEELFIISVSKFLVLTYMNALHYKERSRISGNSCRIQAQYVDRRDHAQWQLIPWRVI